MFKLRLNVLTSIFIALCLALGIAVSVSAASPPATATPTQTFVPTLPPQTTPVPITTPPPTPTVTATPAPPPNNASLFRAVFALARAGTTSPVPGNFPASGTPCPLCEIAQTLQMIALSNDPQTIDASNPANLQSYACGTCLALNDSYYYLVYDASPLQFNADGQYALAQARVTLQNFGKPPKNQTASELKDQLTNLLSDINAALENDIVALGTVTQLTTPTLPATTPSPSATP